MSDFNYEVIYAGTQPARVWLKGGGWITALTVALVLVDGEPEIELSDEDDRQFAAIDCNLIREIESPLGVKLYPINDPLPGAS